MSTTNRSAILILTAMAASVAATARAIPETAPDRGIWLGGAVNLSPFVEGGYIHDSNPKNARKQKEDLLAEHNIDNKSTSGYQIRPGVNIDVPGNCWRLAGRAFYRMERYSKEDVDDRDDWGESLAYSGETDGGLGWRLSESIVQVDLEEQFDGTFPYNYSTHDRLEMAFDGMLSKRITEKCGLEVGGNYSVTDYDAETLYDYYRYGGRLGFAHKLTEKTDWTLSTSYTIHGQDSNSDELDDMDDTQSTKLMVGVRSRSTERVTFDVRGGVEFYEGNDNEDGSSNDKTTFTYALGASWTPAERLSVGLHGLGEYVPSEDIYGSAVDSKTIGVTAAYRIFERWRLSAGFTYRREEYEHRIAKVTGANGNPYMVSDVGSSRDDDIIEFSGRISYALSSYASLYASCSYYELCSSIDDFDYDRTRYGFGAAIRY